MSGLRTRSVADRVPARAGDGSVLRSAKADGRITRIHAIIDDYYSRKLAKYGATPAGVDWKCTATQQMRFVQLLKLCDFSAAFSLNDLGCGYGALVTYLAKYHPEAEVDYLGVDLSATMVRSARRLQRRYGNVKFVRDSVSPRVADYSVASGIFNVKLHQSLDAWEHFVRKTLNDLQATSRRGFAVNFLAPPAPGLPSQIELYRVSSKAWSVYCEQQLGWSVELLDEYGMREFTLLVRPRRSGHRSRRAGSLLHQ
jgi:SAM-dependent methyltransferase